MNIVKKIGLFILITSFLFGSTKYECNRYVNGKYEGYIKIVAESKQEAETKAYAKYKYDLGYKVDYVKCK